MKKIKFARIISGLWRGGVEKKIASVLLRMDRTRFDPAVICLREEGYYASMLRDTGIPVYLSLMKSRWSPSGLWNLRQLLKQQKFDIVHTHMYRSNTSGTAAAKWADIPVIISNIHSVNTWDYPSQIRMDRILTRYKDMFVFVSDAVRRNYIEKIPVPSAAQTVIYNGVDIDRFSPGEKNPMNLSGKIRIGAVGRLMPAKGFEILPRVLNYPELSDQDIKLYILGDGDKRSELEKLAKEYSVDNRFEILGFKDDVIEFLRSIDILVMPSHREGFSNALIEAMAAGVPSIVTDVGGNPEAIRNEVDGLIIPPNDPESLRDAILFLIRNESVRQQMSISARKRAEKFSIDNMVTEIEKLYLNLVESRSG